MAKKKKMYRVMCKCSYRKEPYVVDECFTKKEVNAVLARCYTTVSRTYYVDEFYKELGD